MGVTDSTELLPTSYRSTARLETFCPCTPVGIVKLVGSGRLTCRPFIITSPSATISVLASSMVADSLLPVESA